MEINGPSQQPDTYSVDLEDEDELYGQGKDIVNGVIHDYLAAEIAIHSRYYVKETKELGEMRTEGQGLGSSSKGRGVISIGCGSFRA